MYADVYGGAGSCTLDPYLFYPGLHLRYTPYAFVAPTSRSASLLPPRLNTYTSEPTSNGFSLAAN